LDSHFAKLFSVSLGELDRQKTLQADIMNRHKKGGQSQARFQRLRQGAIHRFLKEVIEALEQVADEQIILAGPGQTKKQFQELLPKHLSEKIVDVIDVDIDEEHRILAESLQIISKKETEASSHAVERLRAEILQDGLSVYGYEDTIHAVKNGQVEVLILEKDFHQKGWICETCQLVKPGNSRTCPICYNPTSEADVLEEILEFAERTDARIEFTDDELIRELGHVGALLRYKT
jgi:peptide chain release factor subunit 1